jgi:hypothetical protein
MIWQSITKALPLRRGERGHHPGRDGPLFVLLLTVLFLSGEQLSGRIIAGSVIIVLGVFCLTGGKHLRLGG